MIRRAGPDDVAALVGLNHEVHQLHLAAMPGRYRDASLAEIEGRVRELLADPEVVIVVADVVGGLVGYVVIRRADNPGHVFLRPSVTAHIGQLGVRADARRGGHGRALMAAAEAQAAAWGATAVTLDVQDFNDGALGFYRALGYAPLQMRLARSL